MASMSWTRETRSRFLLDGQGVAVDGDPGVIVQMMLSRYDDTVHASEVRPSATSFTDFPEMAVFELRPLENHSYSISRWPKSTACRPCRERSEQSTFAVGPRAPITRVLAECSSAADRIES